MKTKLFPLSQRIVIKRTEADEVTKGGLFIPESAKEKPRRGIVIAVAEDTSKLKEGDKILFGKYAGVELIVDAVEYVVMKEEDVIARIEEEADDNERSESGADSNNGNAEVSA